MKWYAVASLQKLPEGDFVLPVVAEGKKLCLIRNENTLYLTDRYCPHAGGNLSGGWCKDGKLICPIHRYEYNLKTGKGAPGQGDYIDVYQLRIVGDEVLAGIEKPWWKMW